MGWKNIRTLVSLLALLLCAACISIVRPRVTDPEIHLVQISPAWDIDYLRGPIDVQYEMIVRNRSDEPLYLTAVELRSVRGGAYSLRRETQPLSRTVLPHETIAVRIWATAWFHGGELTAYEAVRIVGLARFETRRGVRQNVFFEVIP